MSIPTNTLIYTYQVDIAS